MKPRKHRRFMLTTHRQKVAARGKGAGAAIRQVNRWGHLQRYPILHPHDTDPTAGWGDHPPGAGDDRPARKPKDKK